MKLPPIPVLAAVLLLGGCASPIPPAAPSAMVPATLKSTIPAATSIYIETPTLASAAREGKAPYDDLTGTFPLVQPQGLTNFRESAQLTVTAAGAQAVAERGKGTYVLRAEILGGMVIPFPESYSILFVHYQMEDARSGAMLWSRNVYSQAKLEQRVGDSGSGAADPAYGRLAAANLRQMVDSLSAWFAGSRDAKGR